MTEIKLEASENKGKFIIYQNGVFAGEMNYTMFGSSRLIINLTEVEEAFRGEGLAEKLVMAGVEHARKNNIKIIPMCPYAKSLFEENEAIQDVLA